LSPDSSTAVEPFDIAIIGGGAAGVLVAIHLLEASRGKIRLTLIEPRAMIGQGAAYSTQYPEHLLNVVAGRMSAFDAEPMHFTRYLDALVPEHPVVEEALPTARRFAQRREFGRYLQATLAARIDPTALHCQDEAIDIAGTGPYAIALQSGRRISARAVVLALGNFPRSLPVPTAAIHGSPRIENAWDYAAVRRLDPDADLCIVGSGLSMVDAVISLAEVGHRGKITVLSRHGLMPLAHATAGSQDGHIDELLALNVRERMRTLRDHAATRSLAGEPWQWTMDRLRHHGQALWQSLDEAEQRRFLRHAVRIWDIHRHRIAPQIAARIEGMQRTGQLQSRAGHVLSISGDKAAAGVRFRARGRVGDIGEIQAQCVLNCTGVETRLPRMHSPLLQALASRGMIRPGPHEIGYGCDDAGALLSVEGSVQSDLLTLGAARIGQCWESIAIPELRRQAEDISRHLLARLRTPCRHG